MDKANWQRLNEIFAATLALDTGKRAAFLDEHCAPDLRTEVEAMLAAHHEVAAQKFLEADAFDAARRVLADPEAEEALKGKRIGSYRIVREIGRGGMGAVFLATREDFKKRVALKIIKRGMDTDDIVRRFERERKVLAALNHPNIAQLLDGGTTDDGMPFFVMEFVEGLPVTEFCDREKLNIEERLKLFRKICSAVAYAHQHLIVHRDLKPSNILVDNLGEPKLLDFGISKLLDGEAFETTIEETKGIRLMTPEYASPEQIRGEKITTVSDIYSLGVLLYELLSGHRPFRLKNRSSVEILKIIAEHEPSAPSTAALTAEEIVKGDTKEIVSPETIANARAEKPERLRRRLRGDLDNIVLMSLRKEPSRRYSSVEQFSEDMRRHLEGLPVLARPATFVYKASKFVHRNRATVAIASVALIALLAGLSVALWQAYVAKRERARAEKQFNNVRRLSNSFLFEFHDSIKDLSGATASRELVVKRALEYLNELSQEAGENSELREELAAAYERIADIQGFPLSANLGDTKGALESYHKAISLRESLLAVDSENIELSENLGVSYLKLGILYWTSGDAESAFATYQNARAKFQVVMNVAPDNVKLFNRFAQLEMEIGRLFEERNDARNAIEHYRQALQIQQQVLNRTPDDESAQALLARIYLQLGDVSGHPDATYLEDFDEALDKFQKSLAIYQNLLSRNPDNANYNMYYGTMLTKIGDVFLLARAEPKNALDFYRQALEIRRAAAKKDSLSVLSQAGLAFTLSRYGLALAAHGEMTEALKSHSESISISEKLHLSNPKTSSLKRNLALFQQEFGDTLFLKKAFDEAIAKYEEAMRLDSELYSQIPDFRELPESIAALEAKLGLALIAKSRLKSSQDKNFAEGINWLKKGIKRFEELQMQRPVRRRYVVSFYQAKRSLAKFEKEISAN